MGYIVMCVDDEYNANINLEYALKKVEGIDSITTFTNPEIALEYVANNKIDIAFLDIKMPKMTGFELAVKLKEISMAIQIVFISGEEIDKNKVAEIGCVGCLMKPYFDEELNEILALLK